MRIIAFCMLSLSVLFVVYWLGIEVAYLYLNKTLAITFDWSLLFFPGNNQYFLILSGVALYFILDIFYNQFISRKGKNKNRKRHQTLDEKRNYKHLCSLHEAKKGLTRLEFDCSGHLTNVDYSAFEKMIGKLIACIVLITLGISAANALHWCFEWISTLGKQSDPLLLAASVKYLKIAARGSLSFTFCGYAMAFLHQKWSAYNYRTAVSRLLKLHLRDYCDDVFDRPKKIYNSMITKLHLSDVHKMNTKKSYQIGNQKVMRRGGFPVLTYRSRIYVNAADCHSLIVATTRSGKSYSIISIMVDELRMAGESMVINDPKGELKETQVQKLLDDGYEVHFLNFIEPEKGDGWNPLDIAIHKYRDAQKEHKKQVDEYMEMLKSQLEALKLELDQAKTDAERGQIIDQIEALEAEIPDLDTSGAQEALQDIAQAMTYDEKDSNGKFWNSQAAELIVGYANLLLEETTIDPKTGEQVPLPDDLIHFKSIKQVSLAGGTTVGKNETLLGNYLKKYRKSTDKSVTSLGQYVNAPGPTKGSIDSVFSDKSRMMTMSESVMRMTSKSTFDLKDISRKKTAVFIVVHGDKSTYYPFVTMFIEQMYEESMSVAREYGGRMPYPVNCVFDEAGIMPSLKSIDNMVSFGASAGFRLTLAVQDTSQLEHRYGKEVARTLMNNMQNFTYLMGGDNETLKIVSEKAGKRLIWDEERSSYEEKPVISTERLSNLSMGEALTLQLRRNPILTRLLGYNQYCFYKYMPTGNADKPHKLENVRYFDLTDAYRKRESVRTIPDAKKGQAIIHEKKRQDVNKEKTVGLSSNGVVDLSSVSRRGE